MRLQKTPRRFITRFDEENRLNIVFGNGTENLEENILIPNPSDLAIPLRGRKNFTAQPINPEAFLNTNEMGSFPSNTALTVRYIRGGGEKTNVAANTITSFSTLRIQFDPNVSAGDQETVRSSIVVTNEDRATGGDGPIDDDEIRDNAVAFFSSQDRCVSREDFVVRTMTLPKEFGKVFRAYATKATDIESATVQLFVLSKDENNNVIVPTQVLKDNIKQYLRSYRMLTDQVEILDGSIINVGIDFSIIVKSSVAKQLVLGNCLLVLKEFFSVDNWQMGQPIVVSELYELLHNVDGVLSVSNIEIINFVGKDNDTGLEYSDEKFAIVDASAFGVIAPPANALLSVKYPLKDIRGSAL